VPDYDEEVGFGKPPKETRFKKGQSGNPKGRPKGAKNLATIVAEVCRGKVRVKGENGRTYYITTMEAIMKQLTNQAARGDMKATRMFFAMLDMFPEIREPEPEDSEIYINFFSVKDGKPVGMGDHEELVTMPLEEFEKMPHSD
jgi:hypothetical protein